MRTTAGRIGLSLCLVSAWPIARAVLDYRAWSLFRTEFRTNHELLLHPTADRMYSVFPVAVSKVGDAKWLLQFSDQNLQVEFVQMGERQQGPFGDWALGRIVLRLNEKDLSSAAQVRLKLGSDGIDRVFGWLALVPLQRRSDGANMLAVVQKTDGIVDFNESFHRRSEWRYRILLVEASGHVTEDSFSFGDRSHPPYRGALVIIGGLTPHPVGMYADELGWPSAFDLIYPWATGLLGAVLVALEVSGKIRKRLRRSGGVGGGV